MMIVINEKSVWTADPSRGFLGQVKPQILEDNFKILTKISNKGSGNLLIYNLQMGCVKFYN